MRRRGLAAYFGRAGLLWVGLREAVAAGIFQMTLLVSLEMQGSETYYDTMK